MARPLFPERQVDQLEQAILDLIARRPLRSGDRLPPERELVALLDASRPAVREAINRLAADGLLESRHGSGTYVAEVDVAAITEVRLLVEPDAAALAAEARTPGQAARLRRALAALRRHVDDPARFARLDAEIHATLAEACPNPVLRDLLERLARSAALSRTVTGDDPRLRAAALEDLAALVEAVDAGRPADARRAMRRHLRRLPAAR